MATIWFLEKKNSYLLEIMFKMGKIKEIKTETHKDKLKFNIVGLDFIEKNIGIKLFSTIK
jgi:hypothetical protein